MTDAYHKIQDAVRRVNAITGRKAQWQEIQILWAKFLENGGTLRPGEHVHHIRALQPGGGNQGTNLQKIGW